MAIQKVDAPSVKVISLPSEDQTHKLTAGQSWSIVVNGVTIVDETVPDGSEQVITLNVRGTESSV